MHAPISKHQAAWLAIRLCGLFFLYQALVSLSSWFSLKILSSNLNLHVSFISINSGFTQASSLLLLSLLINGAIASYLLVAGGTLHRLLISEDRSPNPSNLRPEETVHFLNWLDLHSDLKSLPEEDQLARFRDYLAEQNRKPS